MQPSRIRDPAVVATPFVAKMSFSATGTPSRGERARALRGARVRGGGGGTRALGRVREERADAAPSVAAIRRERGVDEVARRAAPARRGRSPASREREGGELGVGRAHSMILGTSKKVPSRAGAFASASLGREARASASARSAAALALGERVRHRLDSRHVQLRELRDVIEDRRELRRRTCAPRRATA